MDLQTLSDYEREIHGLRNAMESLQVKLQDAERKLQSQQGSGSSSGSERSASSARQSPAKEVRTVSFQQNMSKIHRWTY